MINNRALLISASIPLLLIIAPLAMALPEGWYAGFIQNAPMYTETEPVSNGKIIKDAIWYLNITDNNYHVKGIMVNTVPRAALVMISMNFYDNATGVRLATGGGFSLSPMGGVPAGYIKYDFNTGYNASNANEFKTIKGLLS